jgi:hypothetical protein
VPGAKAKKRLKKGPAHKSSGGGKRPSKDGKDAGPDAVSDASVGVDSRLLRALLTGINRALPYVAAEEVDALVARVAPAVYRIAHGSSLGASVQALSLLFQMMTARAAASDRFYRALYAALLAPALPRSATAAMFLSLLFRALRADVNPKRVAALIKRLLQARALLLGLCGCERGRQRCVCVGSGVTTHNSSARERRPRPPPAAPFYKRFLTGRAARTAPLRAALLRTALRLALLRFSL